MLLQHLSLIKKNCILVDRKAVMWEKKHLDVFLPGGRKQSGSGAPVSECTEACKRRTQH